MRFGSVKRVAVKEVVTECERKKGQKTESVKERGRHIPEHKANVK